MHFPAFTSQRVFMRENSTSSSLEICLNLIRILFELEELQHKYQTSLHLSLSLSLCSPQQKKECLCVLASRIFSVISCSNLSVNSFDIAAEKVLQLNF